MINPSLQNVRSTLTHRLRVVGVAVFCGVISLGSVTAQQTPAELTDAARKTAERRQQQLSDAQRLIQEGDRRMVDDDFAGATQAYRQAFLDTPVYSASTAVRAAAFGKYQAALRKSADQLAREGRRQEAIELVERFFREAMNNNVSPTQLDAETRYILRDLKDGKVYSSSLTPEHIQRVSQIQELFVKARGFLKSGQYDLAEAQYHQILNLDRHNSAARKGLMEVEEQRMAYQKSAITSTRATMMRQISEEWENPVPRVNVAGLFGGAGISVPTDSNDSVQAKLNSITFPSIEFSETALGDVLQFLTIRSRELDLLETDITKKGVNIVLSADAADAANRPVTMQLNNVPLRVALDYATQLAQMKYRVDQFAVTVVPLTVDVEGGGLLTRNFQVPPDFLNSSLLGDEGGASNDPFANLGGNTDGRGGATLQKKLTAQELLESKGVNFPEGATAQLINATSTLLVRNTQGNLDLIEAIVAGSFGNVTRVLKLDITLLDILDIELKELGFDWLLGQSNLPGSDRIFTSGGTFGNLTEAPAGGLDYPFNSPNGSGAVGQNPLTAGNRSGANLLFRNTIDDRINEANLQLSGATRTPAVFGLSGVFTDPDFQTVLRGIRQHTGSDGMNYLSVVTQSGQRARVENVREFIYPEEYDPPEVPDGTQGQGFFSIRPAFPSAFTTRNIGSSMEVEGIIGPDDLTVNVIMTPEFSQFDGFINYGLPIRQVIPDFFGIGSNFVSVSPNEILMPIFSTVRETVNVEVYDGGTIVVGGLLNESRGEIQDKVPLIGDAPLVGGLFRTNITRSAKRAVFFFVTVNIVDPSGQSIREKLESQR